MRSAFRCPFHNVPELRSRLDEYARARLTLADFEPALNFDAEISLDQVTPELYQVLQRLQPFGVGNPQPVFTARAVRLTAPPRVMKEKHIKLKLAGQLTDNRELKTGNWRKAITFDALGWHMAERCQQAGLLMGDNLEIAFTIDNNDHDEYGGLELSLRDFRAQNKAANGADAKDKNSIAPADQRAASASSP